MNKKTGIKVSLSTAILLLLLAFITTMLIMTTLQQDQYIKEINRCRQELYDEQHKIVMNEEDSMNWAILNSTFGNK